MVGVLADELAGKMADTSADGSAVGWAEKLAAELADQSVEMWASYLVDQWGIWMAGRTAGRTAALMAGTKERPKVDD